MSVSHQRINLFALISMYPGCHVDRGNEMNVR
jgi:hypothetical protein